MALDLSGWQMRICRQRLLSLIIKDAELATDSIVILGLRHCSVLLALMVWLDDRAEVVYIISGQRAMLH